MRLIVSIREEILDAALKVIVEQGVVRATTKQIARAARCSEASLYNYFADKQETLLGVVRERGALLDPPGDLVGTGSVIGNLHRLTGDRRASTSARSR